MSRATEQLIRELSQDLVAVRRLPALWKIAARVVVLSALLAAGSMVLSSALGQPVLKADLGGSDVLGAVAHLVLAAGALGAALATCVPGRDSTARRSMGLLAAGAALTLALSVTVLLSHPVGPLDPSFARGAAWCTLIAALPALLPALLLAIFAGRGVPARPAATLALAALASVALATLPGHLGCPGRAALHTVLGHLLAPLSGGVLVLAVIASLYRPGLPPLRR